jgi:hypothetical protein
MLKTVKTRIQARRKSAGLSAFAPAAERTALAHRAHRENLLDWLSLAKQTSSNLPAAPLPT